MTVFCPLRQLNMRMFTITACSNILQEYLIVVRSGETSKRLPVCSAISKLVMLVYILWDMHLVPLRRTTSMSCSWLSIHIIVWSLENSFFLIEVFGWFIFTRPSIELIISKNQDPRRSRHTRIHQRNRSIWVGDWLQLASIFLILLVFSQLRRYWFLLPHICKNLCFLSYQGLPAICKTPFKRIFCILPPFSCLNKNLTVETINDIPSSQCSNEAQINCRWNIFWFKYQV